MKIEIYKSLSTELIDTLVKVDKAVFTKPLSSSVLIDELQHRKSLLILVAFCEDVPIAYKIGFHEIGETFMSWSGGVVVGHRRKGVATEIMRKQHELVRDMGYKIIKTHTKNKFREMLLLNIKEGFDITGVYQRLNEEQHGIILEKRLDN